MEERSTLEPSIPEASRLYWRVVLITVLAAALLGVLLATLVFNDSKASASILIEDPSGSNVFNTDAALDPERYLASQAAILESSDMAQAVADIQGSTDLTVREILESRTIVTSPEVDIIGIEFVHPDPQRAIDYANSFGKAYEDYRIRTTESGFAAAIAGVDASIQIVDEELMAVDAEIEAMIVVPGGEELASELGDAVEGFLRNPTNISSPERVDEVLSQLQTIQVIRALESQDPAFTLQLERRSDVVDRRSQLVVRRDQLNTDAALASIGIVGFSDSTEAEPSVGLTRVVIAMALLGAIAGVSLAYGLALRNRRFGHRSDPESILGVPMLAEIPEFANMRAIPVKDDPTSPHAEAFRFAATAITARLSQFGTEAESESYSLTVTSALPGEGKTTVAVNVALSLVSSGKRVLVIDGDFEGQSLTRLVTPDVGSSPGVTELLEGTVHLNDVVLHLSLDAGHQVDVLPRGSTGITATDFFGSPFLGPLLNALKTGYDYVIFDGPALLHASYVTYLASHSDAVVTVAPHNGLASSQQEVAKRLAVVGADLVGYIYNHTPKRADTRENRSQTPQSPIQRSLTGGGGN